MFRRIFYITAYLFFIFSTVFAQFSPGDLSKAHQNLEGVSNCTQCHEINNEISGLKCLNCHSFIKSGIDSKRGFHFSNSSNPCVKCHKEHIGKDASITRFNDKSFEHAKTGFYLDGKHSGLDCEKCHHLKNIKIAAIKKSLSENPRKTYIGLNPDCSSCHQDNHKGSFGTNCRKCHSSESWKTASAGFDHSLTKFALTGKHSALQCNKCHTEQQNEGSKEKTLSKITDYGDCNSCHKSLHKIKFADKQCKACHNPDGWTNIAAGMFNHDITPFKLAGKHTKIKCQQCHKPQNKAVLSRAAKDNQDCQTCHKTSHRQNFDNRRCNVCHSVLGWEKVTPGMFNHEKTGFKLIGKHSNLECNKCHKDGSKTNFSKKTLNTIGECTLCHFDIHNNEFKKNYNNDCRKCHNENGFKPSTYSFQNHNKSHFILSGAHAAISCEKCHFKKEEKKLIFAFKSLQCDACHTDYHGGQFKNDMIELSCAKCHNTEEWQNAVFNHSKTGFELIGKHSETKCSGCHKKIFINKQEIIQYRSTPKKCNACHKNIHNNQFNQNDDTNCTACHTPTSWKNVTFDHEKQSNYSLSGAHTKVQCKKCHTEIIINGEITLRFSKTPKKCEECHQKKEIKND